MNEARKILYTKILRASIKTKQGYCYLIIEKSTRNTWGCKLWALSGKTLTHISYCTNCRFNIIRSGIAKCIKASSQTR